MTAKKARSPKKARDALGRPLRLEYRRAGDLEPHPLNWRIHPPSQVDAVRESIADVGWADARVRSSSVSGRRASGYLW